MFVFSSSSLVSEAISPLSTSTNFSILLASALYCSTWSFDPSVVLRRPCTCTAWSVSSSFKASTTMPKFSTSVTWSASSSSSISLDSFSLSISLILSASSLLRVRIAEECREFCSNTSACSDFNTLYCSASLADSCVPFPFKCSMTPSRCLLSFTCSASFSVIDSISFDRNCVSSTWSASSECRSRITASLFSTSRTFFKASSFKRSIAETIFSISADWLPRSDSIDTSRLTVSAVWKANKASTFFIRSSVVSLNSASFAWSTSISCWFFCISTPLAPSSWVRVVISSAFSFLTPSLSDKSWVRPWMVFTILAISVLLLPFNDSMTASRLCISLIWLDRSAFSVVNSFESISNLRTCSALAASLILSLFSVSSAWSARELRSILISLLALSVSAICSDNSSFKLWTFLSIFSTSSVLSPLRDSITRSFFSDSRMLSDSSALRASLSLLRLSAAALWSASSARKPFASLPLFSISMFWSANSLRSTSTSFSLFCVSAICSVRSSLKVLTSLTLLSVSLIWSANSSLEALSALSLLSNSTAWSDNSSLNPWTVFTIFSISAVWSPLRDSIILSFFFISADWSANSLLIISIALSRFSISRDWSSISTLSASFSFTFLSVSITWSANSPFNIFASFPLLSVSFTWSVNSALRLSMILSRLSVSAFWSDNLFRHTSKSLVIFSISADWSSLRELTVISSLPDSSCCTSRVLLNSSMTLSHRVISIALDFALPSKSLTSLDAMLSLSSRLFILFNRDFFSASIWSSFSVHSVIVFSTSASRLMSASCDSDSCNCNLLMCALSDVIVFSLVRIWFSAVINSSCTAHRRVSDVSKDSLALASSALNFSLSLLLCFVLSVAWLESMSTSTWSSEFSCSRSDVEVVSSSTFSFSAVLSVSLANFNTSISAFNSLTRSLCAASALSLCSLATSRKFFTSVFFDWRSRIFTVESSTLCCSSMFASVAVASWFMDSSNSCWRCTMVSFVTTSFLLVVSKKCWLLAEVSSNLAFHLLSSVCTVSFLACILDTIKS